MQSQSQSQSQSTNKSTTTSTFGQAAGLSSAMPPPPVPPAKRLALEREAKALSSCFKNAVVKTGQVYAFHADTRRLRIHKYAPYPPRTLTASLGRELEKYDQICDAIESQLLRAISVLKRDLGREERRAREAEQAVLSARAPKMPIPSVESGDAMLPSGQSSLQGHTLVPMRRQSAISLSSLNRSALPPKLDLSSSSMRISAEEAALFPKGLVPSPVSLAPKSARPSTTADIDLMAAFASAAAANSGSQRVEIDLTDPESPPRMSGIDPSLGNTADKPIELDLDGINMEMSDMTNLFGDGPEPPGDGQATADSLFSPETAGSGAPLSANEAPQTQNGDGRIDMDLLGALHNEHDNQDENLFSVASGSSNGNNNPHPGSGTVPPPSLVSSFIQASMQGSVGGFDLSTLELSNLDPAWQNMSLEALLNMSSSGSNPEGQKPGP